MTEDEAILWSSISRFHDWKRGDFPAAVLRRAMDSGIIGVPEWVEPDPDGERQPFKPVAPRDAPPTLLAMAPPTRAVVNVSCGGEQPHEWELSMVLPPFDEEDGQVDGYGIINIRVRRDAFSSSGAAGRLLDSFLAVHAPSNTEFAFVHPAGDWADLKLTTYNRPVTKSPMFAGVYWANFLGPGHIDQFEPGALRDVRAYRVERRDGDGLFVIVAPDLRTLESPETRADMIRLTEEFRRAWKKPQPRRGADR